MVSQYIETRNTEGKAGLKMLSVRFLWRCPTYNAVSKAGNWWVGLC